MEPAPEALHFIFFFFLNRNELEFHYKIPLFKEFLTREKAEEKTEITQN